MAFQSGALRLFLHQKHQDLATDAEALWRKSLEIHDRQNRPDSNENGRVHVERVEYNMFRLLQTSDAKSRTEHLSELEPMEIFLLSCAACCHDFDKALKSGAPLPSGFQHGEGSGEFVVKNAAVLGLNEHQATALKQAVAIHDLKSPDFERELSKLNWQEMTPEGPINLQRVALLLKAADILHFDISRVHKRSGFDVEELDGLERKKYLTRYSTKGWAPDGTRIVVQASPNDPEKRKAFQECFDFMRTYEWKAVGSGLQTLSFPFALELDNSTKEFLRGETARAKEHESTEKMGVGESVLLLSSKAPETFSTRKAAADKLGMLFQDKAKKLIFVQAPFGWGKDVIMREGLIAARTPSHRTIDISRITDARRLAEKLLQHDSLSDHELFDIEDDFRTATEILRGRFHEKYGNPGECLLFFLYSNLNLGHVIPRNILNAILLLAESGFRCVVESWDLEQTHLGRNLSPESIAFFTRKDLSELSETEVADWLSKRHITDAGIKGAIKALEGHPLHIRVTLDGLMRRAATGLPVTETEAIDESLKFLAGRGDFSLYEDYVLENLGGTLDPLLVQWASMIRDHPFPLPAFSPDQKKQAEMLVRLGLAYVHDAQIHPLGWFRFYCFNKLAQESQGKLLINPSQLDTVDSISRERIARDLMDFSAGLGIALHE